MSLAFLNKRQRAILETLHPALRMRVEHVLEGLEGRLVPLSGHRPPEEQAALFEKGRIVKWGANFAVLEAKVIGKVVTNAPPFESAHNFSPSRAVDCVLNHRVVKVAEREWQGKMWPDLWDTKSKDAIAAWEDYGIHAKDVGLVWGGHWKMKDRPHVELPDFSSSTWD